MVASSASRKNPPMTTPRFRMLADRLTIENSTTSLNYPKHTKTHMNKSMKRRSGNHTSNPTSGDDLLELGSFIDCMPPPQADLHPKINKQKTKIMLFHIQVRVRC